MSLTHENGSCKHKQPVENHIEDDALLKAKLDVWEKFCVTADCEDNVFSGVAACK